ncbi:MAG: AraC family transcriptional regulator, partial [Terriglobia bacterium]
HFDSRAYRRPYPPCSNQPPGPVAARKPHPRRRSLSYVRIWVKAITLFFVPDLIRRCCDPSGHLGYLMPFMQQDSAFPHIVPAKTGLPEEAVELFERIHAELPANTERARLTVKTYLKMILILLVNHYATYHRTIDVFDRRQRALQRLQPLFEFLGSNYSEPLRLRNVAAMLGMSKSDFMRFFKYVTGQSFVSYLNHFRIAKAEILLATSGKSMSDISQEVGFCDQSYFGLIFRRLIHMTPLQYRQSLAGAKPESARSPHDSLLSLSNRTTSRDFANPKLPGASLPAAR